MPRYELSIKATYLPGWGVYEGVRELVQNAKDSETQFDAPMTVKFAKRRRNGEETGGILIINEGCTLPVQALLIGHTTKVDDSRLIGKFGEGLKFGVLALLRAGVEVKIRNGSEVWTPVIAWSNQYGADVLAFDVTRGHADSNRVQMEVVGVTEPQWRDIKSKLLFLGEMPEHVECHSGEVLTDPRYRGKVFVKGMYVGNRNGIFGFNFKDADIDRDRRMISDAESKVTHLLAEALNQGHLITSVYGMLSEGQENLYGLHYRLTEEACASIAEEFLRDNPNTIPVETDAEKTELEHLGSRGLKVPYALRNIVQQKTGTAADHIARLRRSAKHTYHMNDLTVVEVENLQASVGIMRRALAKLGEVKPNPDVSVVDFSDDRLQGTYNTETGAIRLARKVLESRAKTLVVLIHEAGHKHGLDGAITHSETVEKITEKVLEELLQV